MSSNKRSQGNKDDKKNTTNKEDSPAGVKDDGASVSTGSNGGASGEPSQPGSKPGSAGATVREGAQRLLALAARGEWAPVDQLLKSMEKAVQQNAAEEGYVAPLAGLMDPVSMSDVEQFIVVNNRNSIEE